MLLLVTFLDPALGAVGLSTVLFSNFLALWMGFSKPFIAEGSYGFNSLLVGLGMGVYYQPDIPFFILLAVASLITFLITVAVSGVLAKYGLPYLSIPFLLALWSILLASRHFESLGVNQRGVYFLNELYEVGSHWLVNLYHQFNGLPIHESIKIYLKSLGAILFQFNIVSGIVIATGLLISSRIAFTLSLLSFFTAYYFYLFIGADISELSYSYIGFNFILTGMAVGAFFLIPSRHSYMWAILLVPPMVILSSSLGHLFEVLHLSIYSLPYNLVVITFLYVLKLRFRPQEPTETTVQLFHPEKNLYERLSNIGRYQNFMKLGIGLPVLGEWSVSQGQYGQITHIGEWAHAWDFVVVDGHGKQFKKKGRNVEDYYCYNKPVFAPADGVVEVFVDHIEDNIPGDSNLAQNWGNSIVIRHDAQLYSQISHLKKGSVKVKIGDEVKKGTMLATCGNSGRSPEPHVHFQLQRTPFIGSKTMRYPLNHFVVNEKEKRTYKFFDYPKEASQVANITGNDLLKKAFHFIPGRILSFTVTTNSGEPVLVEWEVLSDSYNNSYLYCHQSKSTAYFKNDDTLFYFTFFEGNKKSLLYHFYLGAFKVLLSYDHQLSLEDRYPLYIFSPLFPRIIHDFTASFFQYMEARFSLNYVKIDNELSPKVIHLRSTAKSFLGNKVIKEIDYNIQIENDGIAAFNIKSGNLQIKAQCIEQ